MKPSKYSQETLERMKANAAAAKKRLMRLNNEYLVRQKALQMAKFNGRRAESFGEAVTRIAKESQILV